MRSRLAISPLADRPLDAKRSRSETRSGDPNDSLSIVAISDCHCVTHDLRAETESRNRAARAPTTFPRTISTATRLVTAPALSPRVEPNATTPTVNAGRIHASHRI